MEGAEGEKGRYNDLNTVLTYETLKMFYLKVKRMVKDM